MILSSLDTNEEPLYQCVGSFSTKLVPIKPDTGMKWTLFSSNPILFVKYFRILALTYSTYCYSATSILFTSTITSLIPNVFIMRAWSSSNDFLYSSPFADTTKMPIDACWQAVIIYSRKPRWPGVSSRVILFFLGVTNYTEPVSTVKPLPISSLEASIMTAN